MLLSEDAWALFVDWEVQARAAVESLRLELARDPDDRAATALVADLSERSEEFRLWWAEHGVHQRTHGTKRLDHPVVGGLDVQFESLQLPGDPGQTLYVYSTEPGTPSRDAMGAACELDPHRFSARLTYASSLSRAADSSSGTSCPSAQTVRAETGAPQSRCTTTTPVR